jgi:hypothetical protein
MWTNVMTTYWFRPKRYGYGATPMTWQGWTITLATVAVVVAASFAGAHFGVGKPWVALPVLAIGFIAFAALWRLSRRKTDGEWRWRRGG